jgi:hypothetical protein
MSGRCAARSTFEANGTDVPRNGGASAGSKLALLLIENPFI